MKNLLYLLSFVALLSSACKTTPKPASNTSNSDTMFTGTHWVLKELNGQKITLEGRVPFIKFDGAESRVSGNSGCNSFFGKFKTDGFNLEIGETGATKVACFEDNRMEIETQFFAVFQQVDSYTIHGNTLILRKGKMPSLAVFEAGQPAE